MGVLTWDIYDVTSRKSSLNGIMLRGRIRKLGIENRINVLVENTEDRDNGVRFAVLNQQDAVVVISYLKSILDDVSVELIKAQIQNPVLSKLKINIADRYHL